MRRCGSKLGRSLSRLSSHFEIARDSQGDSGASSGSGTGGRGVATIELHAVYTLQHTSPRETRHSNLPDWLVPVDLHCTWRLAGMPRARCQYYAYGAACGRRARGGIRSCSAGTTAHEQRAWPCAGPARAHRRPAQPGRGVKVEATAKPPVHVSVKTPRPHQHCAPGLPGGGRARERRRGSTDPGQAALPGHARQTSRLKITAGRAGEAKVAVVRVHGKSQRAPPETALWVFGAYPVPVFAPFLPIAHANPSRFWGWG